MHKHPEVVLDDTIPGGEKPVRGAAAIGDEVGLNPRQTYHLLKKGLLPAVKIGDAWFAYPSALRAAFRPAS